jgi:DNA-3-methyladenine glycosylase
MFGPAGIAYVYLVYGMYDCLNVVTGPDGTAAAVLIRAVEPLEGLDRMRADRLARRPSQAIADRRLASGPGLAAMAFGLDRSWTGTDLCDPASPLRLESPTMPLGTSDILATPRIGVGYAGEPWASRPWRLVIAGHPSASGPRATR